MARGRRAEPAAVKQAKGNPGRRKIVDAPDAPAAPVAAPKDLSAAARKVWNQLAPELSRLKFLRPSDQQAFSRYCEHLAKWWELTKDLRKEGETYGTNSAHGSMLRVNPKFIVRERVEKRLEALEDRFGLSPAARQQILQRLAAINVPLTPAGSLFDRTENTGGEAPAPQDAAPAGSPIGLLGRASSVH